MVSELALHNYRGFRKFKLEELTRVNLLVGKNNCGKTSILEALNLLYTEGDLIVLNKLANERGEVLTRSNDSDQYFQRDRSPDVSHLFHGHQLRPGSKCVISTEKPPRSLTFRVDDTRLLDEDQLEQMVLFEQGDGDQVEFDGVLALSVVSKSESEKLRRYPISAEGALLVDRRRLLASTRRRGGSVSFITPDSLLPQSMSQLWDQALIEGQEKDVVRAMQILEPRLKEILFLSSQRPYRFDKGGVLVDLEGQERRVPLGSYGEGMRRLLALSLSLVNASDGILLVDEIDTGLHWSIMADMWRLIISGASERNVQVLATTHSFDCLRGLQILQEEGSEFTKHVSLQKIDQSLEKAVALSTQEISTALEQDIEVR